jgi:hypothetical protein
MTEVFVERTFEEPVTDEVFDSMVTASAGCFDLYRVEWRQSFLSGDRHRLFCWFAAPDAESTRLALRMSGSHDGIQWPGTVHDSPASDAPPAEAANVLVQRSWDEPVTLEEIQAIEDAAASCLETHNVQFVRTFFSRDRRRMVCLYRAPDAEAVRVAQRKAGMSVDSVWDFQVKSR